MELIQIYLTNLLYIIMFFSLNFSLLDPDSGGKMNADPDRKPWKNPLFWGRRRNYFVENRAIFSY